MNHDILLLKLKFYGVIGKAYTLIKSYLKDRYQRVLIDNRHYNSISSDWAKLNTMSLRVQYLVLCFSFSV